MDTEDKEDEDEDEEKEDEEEEEINRYNRKILTSDLYVESTMGRDNDGSNIDPGDSDITNSEVDWTFYLGLDLESSHLLQ